MTCAYEDSDPGCRDSLDKLALQKVSPLHYSQLWRRDLIVSVSLSHGERTGCLTAPEPRFRNHNRMKIGTARDTMISI